MTAVLSDSSAPELKRKTPVIPLSGLVPCRDTARAAGPRIEIGEGPQDHTKHAGIAVIQEFWQIFGVPQMLQDAGIVKQAGVPAEAVAFLQTAAALLGKGTVRDTIRELQGDPVLPRICGCEEPFGKQVIHRFLEDERFDFDKLNWSRVQRLQEIEETRFRRDGWLLLDGCLVRKTSTHFVGIRILFDHVTDSYRPAYDGLSLVYSRKKIEHPVDFQLRLMNDLQFQCLRQEKAAKKSFKELIGCARKASLSVPIFIRPSHFSTANLKTTDRAGLSWVAQVNQTLKVIQDGELTKVKNIRKGLERSGAFVSHPELGTSAAGCRIKLPAYGRPVKLFFLWPESGNSCKAFLTESLQLDERGFQELFHQLRGDFGEDKLTLALNSLRRLHDMGCPTHRLVFDEWFLCRDFCKEVSNLGYHWYSQAGSRQRFKIRGREMSMDEVIRTYKKRATKLRGFGGLHAFKIGARWIEYGPVQIVVVVEDGRKPYLLITNELKARTSLIVRGYKTRWRIEVFFRTSKQDLNLEGFRVRSLRAIKAHITLTLLAYTLLKLLGFIDAQLMEKSIGSIKKEIINITATVKILKTKIKLIFSEAHSLLDRYYVFQLVKGTAKRRLGPATAAT